MFVFKRCCFFYDRLNSFLKIDWVFNSLKFFYLIALNLKFFNQTSFKKKYFLNSLNAITFFSTKKILDHKDFFYFRVLKIYGLGFKISIDFSFIKLDLGWSHALFQKIPPSLIILKKNDKLLIYGLLKDKVFNFADVLISLYERSVYQIKGVFDIHEKIKKKIGKQRQK